MLSKSIDDWIACAISHQDEVFDEPVEFSGVIPLLNRGTLECDHEIYVDENAQHNKFAMVKQTFTFKNETSTEAEEGKAKDRREEKKERECAENDDHTHGHRHGKKRTVGASKRFSIFDNKDGGAQREMDFLAQRLGLMEQQMAMH